MALNGNFSALSDKLKASNCRSIVLVDKQIGGSAVWCFFDHPYTVQPTQVSAQQFDTTKEILKHLPENSVVSIEQIPILENIGGFKTTVIVKNSNGTLTCSNGETASLDLLMGLE